MDLTLVVSYFGYRHNKVMGSTLDFPKIFVASYVASHSLHATTRVQN